jgi:hypothetical protein
VHLRRRNCHNRLLGRSTVVTIRYFQDCALILNRPCPDRSEKCTLPRRFAVPLRAWPLAWPRRQALRGGRGSARKTSDAVKLSSCCGKFLRGVGEGDGLVVVLPGGQAAVEAAEEPSEEVALGGGVPVAGLAAAVVVGAGAG